MGSRDPGSRTVVVPENGTAPEVIHFTARTERPQSPRDGEPKAGSSSGESGDPSDKKEENTGSGGVMLGGALLLGGAMLSSGGSGEWDDDEEEEKKMMIAPGTNRMFKMPRKDFEDDPSGYFRRLRGKD
ncbi:hypothetical protein NMG60_11009388 [Bertholletia excelsa]